MATKNKKASIHSAMARFEATISQNNESGVESKMFLSTIAKHRPSMGRREGSKQKIVPSRLSRVPETASASTSTASTASTTIMGSVNSPEPSMDIGSVHSRASSVGMVVGMGEQWGTFEEPDDDPWANNDDDGFGDFGGGDGFGGGDSFGDGVDFTGGLDDDDWQNVASSSQNDQTETPKSRTPASGGRKPQAPKPSSGGTNSLLRMSKALTPTLKASTITGGSPVSSVDGPSSPPSSGGTSSRLRLSKALSSSNSKTFMLTGSSPAASADGAPPSPFSRKKRSPLDRSKSKSKVGLKDSDDVSIHSSGSRSTSKSPTTRKKLSLRRPKSKSQTQDSDDVSADVSTGSRSKKVASRQRSVTSTDTPPKTVLSRSSSKDGASVQSSGGARMTKAPSRSFRHRPSDGDIDNVSVSSVKKKVSRSSRPEGSSSHSRPEGPSSHRRLPSSSSSRRVSSQVSP